MLDWAFNLGTKCLLDSSHKCVAECVYVYVHADLCVWGLHNMLFLQYEYKQLNRPRKIVQLYYIPTLTCATSFYCKSSLECE